MASLNQRMQESATHIYLAGIYAGKLLSMLSSVTPSERKVARKPSIIEYLIMILGEPVQMYWLPRAKRRSGTRMVTTHQLHIFRGGKILNFHRIPASYSILCRRYQARTSFSNKSIQATTSKHVMCAMNHVTKDTRIDFSNGQLKIRSKNYEVLIKHGCILNFGASINKYHSCTTQGFLNISISIVHINKQFPTDKM